MAVYYVELSGGDIQPNASLSGGGISVANTLAGGDIYPGGSGGGGASLVSTSVSYTPTTSAISDTLTPPTGYDGFSQVDVTVDAVPLGGNVGISSSIQSNGAVASVIHIGTGGYFASGDYNASTDPGEVTVRTSSDLTASGATVTAPAGYYASNATKTIPNASIVDGGIGYDSSTNTMECVLTVNTPGYVSSGWTITEGDALSQKAAATYHPSTSDQTIAANQYLTGAQTIKGVTYTNLTAGNIKKDVVVEIGDSADSDRIVSVTGTYEGGGGGGLPTAPNNDVNYIDYDGTIRYSYTKAEFAQLASHPTSPTHSGLTSQGWNWTLSDAQTFVAQYGVLDIGAQYVTDDGATRLYVQVRGTAYRPTAKVNFSQSASNGVTFDWGDGSATQTYSGTGTQLATHDYSSDGEYVISLKPGTGVTLTLQGAWNANVMGNKQTSLDAVNSASLTKIEIGANTALAAQSLSACDELDTIILSYGITSLTGDALFRDSTQFHALVIPSSVTSIGGANFVYNTNIERMSLPNSITTTNSNGLGDTARRFKRFVFSGSGWNMSGILRENASIRDVVLPSGAFSSTSLGLLQNCVRLAHITIPADFTTIPANAFAGCYGMKEYHFLATTPPTLSNTNAFSNIQSDCKIYVPSAALSAYQTANNWSTYSSYMVGE